MISTLVGLFRLYTKMRGFLSGPAYGLRVQGKDKPMWGLIVKKRGQVLFLLIFQVVVRLVGVVLAHSILCLIFRTFERVSPYCSLILL